VKPAIVEPVTLIRAGAPTGEYDAGGYPILGPDVEIVSEGWKVAPRSSTESTLNYGQTVITGVTIYNRFQVVVLSSDSVIVRGVTWAVDGDIAGWRNGVVVNLKKGS